MKQCFTCKQWGSIGTFPMDKDKKDGHSSYCYSCKRRQEFDYRYKHKARRWKQFKERKERLIQGNRIKLLEYLDNHPCIDCGENDPIVLQFDHQRDKISSLSKMVMSGLCWETLFKEIGKCEVRCANCHTRRTAKQQSWWKLISRGLTNS